MKEALAWLLVVVLGVLTPIQEYILTCEVLILLNWIAYTYVKTIEKKKKKKKKERPIYIDMFFATVAIVTARVMDILYLKSYTVSYSLSLTLVLYYYVALFKNISTIIGIDLTKFIPKR